MFIFEVCVSKSKTSALFFLLIHRYQAIARGFEKKIKLIRHCIPMMPDVTAYVNT